MMVVGLLVVKKAKKAY